MYICLKHYNVFLVFNIRRISFFGCPFLVLLPSFFFGFNLVAFTPLLLFYKNMYLFYYYDKLREDVFN